MVLEDSAYVKGVADKAQSSVGAHIACCQGAQPLASHASPDSICCEGCTADDLPAITARSLPAVHAASCPHGQVPCGRAGSGRVQGNDVGAKLEYMLSTGNLQSRGGLDMSQATGFTIVAERLNFVR